MRIVFAGSMGRFPVGGHAWTNLQFLCGLRDLGHDVVYLEECGDESWVYKWETDELTTELDYPTSYIRACLEPIGLGERWIYRAGEQSEGMPVADFEDYCAQADLVLVRAVPLGTWRPEYALPRRRAFIDVDPGFTQVRLADGERQLKETVSRCERLFTIAQRFGRPDCTVPMNGIDWIKTVSPVWLPGWPVADNDSTDFTLILQWESYKKAHRYSRTVHKGVRYGQKEEVFADYMDLPSQTGKTFRMAVTGGPQEKLREHGWDVVQGWQATQTVASYRNFITRSGAELGIAKHGYVMSRAGWFSDRSACYLACGKPVLLQDTGLGDWLPTGEGIVTFSDADEAKEGVEAICADYARHRRAARQLAESYFATDKVLPPLLEAAME